MSPSTLHDGREPGGGAARPDEDGSDRERTAELAAVLRSLQASEAMYRALVDTTGTGYAVVDEGGRIVDANPEYVRLAGHRELGDIRGRPVFDWTAPQDRRKNADALARCAAAGRLRAFEVDYVDPSGRVTPVEINATVVEQDGERRMLALCRDISERRRTEERLIESQRELMRNEKLAVLGQLAGSLAHELRNPLGVVRNAAFFLGTIVPEGDPRIREYLGIIMAEVASSQRIISDLLEFSRGRAARAERALPGSLVALALAGCAVPEGVEVALDLPESLPAVEVDPLQLRQVFQNLISNAVEAMPGGGRIALSARHLAGDGAVEVRVEDSGEGIAPEHLSRLFQPLFTTKARGIGLGLTVVKRNVEANRGTISVASVPGRGTTFVVRLPIAADAGEGSP
jgi:PAS domain S-box-containing protein